MLICYPMFLVNLPHLISSTLPLVLQITLMVWGWWFSQILAFSFLLLFHNGLVLLYLIDLFKSFPNIWGEFHHKQRPTLPLSLWSFASFRIFVNMEECLCSVYLGVLFLLLILPTQQPRVCSEQEAQCCSVSFAACMYQDFLMYRVSLVAQTVKNLPAIQETWVQSLDRENLLEEEMATHSSVLAWRIPRTEEPGGPQSVGSQSDTTEQLTLSRHFH